MESTTLPQAGYPLGVAFTCGSASVLQIRDDVSIEIGRPFGVAVVREQPRDLGWHHPRER
jgi:hypothetical protein